MKLYAKCNGSEGGRLASKGSNNVLTIELFNGNNIQGLLTLNTSTNELVYSKFNFTEFTPVYREALRDTTNTKGKTQQS